MNDPRSDVASPADLLSEFEELLRTVAEEVSKSAVVPAVVEAQKQWERLLERQVGLLEDLHQQAKEDSRRASELHSRLERLSRLAVGTSATSLLVAVVLVIAVLLAG